MYTLISIIYIYIHLILQPFKDMLCPKKQKLTIVSFVFFCSIQFCRHAYKFPTWKFDCCSGVQEEHQLI